MSANTAPIPPVVFAAAIKDLDPCSLRLKLLETRNSIAHLQYSNHELRPFADGSAAIMGAPSDATPDQDCIDAMSENSIVIDRMLERIDLLRREVALRGLDWADFDTSESLAKNAEAGAQGNAVADQGPEANGDAAEQNQRPHAAWSDGTFQTGSLIISDLRIDDEVELSDSQASQTEERPGHQSSPPNGTHDPEGGQGIHL
ncbi:hypothetical protein CDD80_5403 [Ophiocordyceps camponoti-rufipedis]|uniref:Uncharacterized protein n=1 Tax=Ophiocordyceps camponoti-rufipedis TaxID=2004952 RepID=A0A2C5YP17_9HYPO|nr:hypothetical protein CDD80_5403 [Ophiocordyceps camponoti-rufipedis]